MNLEGTKFGFDEAGPIGKWVQSTIDELDQVKDLIVKMMDSMWETGVDSSDVELSTNDTFNLLTATGVINQQFYKFFEDMFDNNYKMLDYYLANSEYKATMKKIYEQLEESRVSAYEASMEDGGQ